jgi:hypothetical protein
MAAKHHCPFCERQLAVHNDCGPILTCDGCGGQFNPGKLLYRPASVMRQILGWILILTGVFDLFGSVSLFVFAAIFTGVGGADSGGIDLMFVFAINCVFSFAVFAGGLALKRGRIVIDTSPAELPWNQEL